MHATNSFLASKIISKTTNTKDQNNDKSRKQNNIRTNSKTKNNLSKDGKFSVDLSFLDSKNDFKISFSDEE